MLRYFPLHYRLLVCITFWTWILSLDVIRTESFVFVWGLCGVFKSLIRQALYTCMGAGSGIGRSDIAEAGNGWAVTSTSSSCDSSFGGTCLCCSLQSKFIPIFHCSRTAKQSTGYKSITVHIPMIMLCLLDHLGLLSFFFLRFV